MLMMENSSLYSRLPSMDSLSCGVWKKCRLILRRSGRMLMIQRCMLMDCGAGYGDRNWLMLEAAATELEIKR